MHLTLPIRSSGRVHLAAVGLKAENNDSVESDDVTVGTFSSEPTAGSDAKAGDYHHLAGWADISRRVTEMTAERVRPMSPKDAGFKVDTQQQPSSSVPERPRHLPVSSNGRADGVSTVTIVVSSGAPERICSNVVGRTLATRSVALENGLPGQHGLGLR